ncbi:MAG TPA: hypothetical protein VG916_01765 [Gemmatimonadaceae bacterium]|nr:hypothetical protein [Gemmatimonadaceae bacterium]
MLHDQQEMVNVLDRAAEFAKEFQTELGSGVGVTNLEAARAALVAEGREQVGADKAKLAGTRTKNDFREELYGRHMVPISRIARTRWDKIPVPKMEDFRVPERGASDVTLLEAARAMATVSAEYFEVLRPDLGNDFVDQLNASITALHDSILARDNHRFRRSRATTAIDLRVKEARRVLAVMTSVVERTFTDRPELVKEWRRRTRITRKPGVPRGTVRPTSTDSPPATATTEPTPSGTTVTVPASAPAQPAGGETQAA